MGQITIPPLERVEWDKMISGEIEHKYRNYVLQIQLTNLRRKVKRNELSKQQAIAEFHTLCKKYAMAVQIDLKHIFKNW